MLIREGRELIKGASVFAYLWEGECNERAHLLIRAGRESA